MMIMELLPQERVLLESDNKTLKLTTHRVRHVPGLQRPNTPTFK